MAIEVTKQIYKPSMTVGQVYAAVYGAAVLPMPVGNALELSLEHSEDVQTQDDMTRLGGGTYAEVRRVKEVKVKMKLADLNVVNLARSVLGNVAAIGAGTVVDEPFVATPGGLLALEHINATDVVVKKGPDALTATVVNMAGNYVPQPEGVVLQAEPADITGGDMLWVSYSYGAYAAIEALTTKAVELHLLFGGLNEADSGNPMVVDIFRASQGVTKQLALVNKGFNTLDVEGTVLMDPTKVGAGLSRYYRARMS